MTIPILQCGKCKFNLAWEPPEDDSDFRDIGRFTCEEYPEAIPDFVENVTENCPKFKQR